MNLQGQDWGEVVIRKKKPTAAQAQTEQAVNEVRSAGMSDRRSAGAVLTRTCSHAGSAAGGRY